MKDQDLSFNKSVVYDFTDTLLFLNVADKKFPNHPILSSSKERFLKIFVNNDVSNLKKKYSKREGVIVMPPFVKQNFPIVERNLFDFTQKREIKTFWKGCVFNDKFEGICDVYREDNSLLMRYNSVDGEEHGLRQVFDMNGDIWENSMFINGIEIGFKIRKSFDEEGFNREEIYNREEGSGIIRGMFKDGAIYFIEEYIQDKRHGTWKEYYENGQLKWEKIYKENKLITQNKFHKNGKRKTNSMIIFMLIIILIISLGLLNLF